MGDLVAAAEAVAAGAATASVVVLIAVAGATFPGDCTDDGVTAGAGEEEAGAKVAAFVFGVALPFACPLLPTKR
jgi:hypothetical protein